VDVDNREHKEDYTSTKENESNEEFYKYYHGPKDELSQIQSKGKSRQHASICTPYLHKDKTDYGKHRSIA
jgi:hypothetical protein